MPDLDKAHERDALNLFKLQNFLALGLGRDKNPGIEVNLGNKIIATRRG